MIFGGGKILFIFGAFIFALQVSTSNAYYLNNNGYGNGTVPENYMKDEGCNGCVGYKCKLNDGKIFEGKDCLKNVVKFCGLSKSDVSKLKSVVQEKVYEYKSEKYFIYSCQDYNDEYDEMGEEEDYMDVEWPKNGDDDMGCSEDVVVPPEHYEFSDLKKYIESATKCTLEITERYYFKRYRISQNALNDVKTAAEDILKTIDYAKKANEIMKDGEYFKKKSVEILQKAGNVSTIITDADKMLKDLERILFTVEKKCVEFNKTAIACLNETFNCTKKQYDEAINSCEDPNNDAFSKAYEYFEKSKELMESINKIKPEAEKVFMEANVALTAQNAQELAKEAKRIGESAKKEAKESKEIGENSNKIANFAIEIGIEAKIAANESMKIGNEANQKIMEVEKMAKDSLKLAEKNQKLGDETEAEIQKLKSNGEKIGCKFSIFAILLFAFSFIFL